MAYYASYVMALDDSDPMTRKKLIQEWNYMRPRGPHMDAKGDINEMADADVERLLEIGDEMAEALK